MNNIAKFDGVFKGFGKVMALKDVSLEVNGGGIIGLIGANGCGKSTLLRHMIGLYLADSGTVETFDCDAGKLEASHMSRIGYVHQEGQLLYWMSVKQHIEYIAAYYDNWNVDLQERFIEQFDIDLKARVGKLSPGKRQQLAILLATCHEPELLILDEPASALDPISRVKFLDLLLEIIQDDQNRTVIISSHILSDIEKIIDHVIIMDDGKVINDVNFDLLRENYCRVQFSGLGDGANLEFDNVLHSETGAGQAVFVLEKVDSKDIAKRATELGCKYDVSMLTLEEIYRLILDKKQAS